MRLLFIADPLDGFKTAKDSTFAMMREAAARGHALMACEPKDLMWQRGGVVTAFVRDLTLTGDAYDWYRAAQQPPHERPQPLHEVDAVLMRKDPPFDSEYFYATHLLEQAEREGARVFNKPLDGMGGMGIFRVQADGLNLGSITETLNRHGATTIMVQRFLPEIVRGDKRILLIGGEPVPYALARIPQGSEVRGNLAAGGKGVAQPLSQRDREIAEGLGPILAARGLLLVGLDVIGDCLTEINVTSPTGFQEITKQAGYDVAKRFIDALEAALR